MWSSPAKIREAQISNGFKSTEAQAKEKEFVNLCKNIANKFDVSEAKQEAAASEFKNNFKEPKKYLVACSKADARKLLAQRSCALPRMKDARFAMASFLEDIRSKISFLNHLNELRGKGLASNAKASG